MNRLAATLAALLATASAVTAMEGRDLDIDRDGFATKEEIAQILGGFTASDFNALDLNDDGRLSVPELQAPGTHGIIGRYGMTMSVVHGLSDVDTDGDDHASQEELSVIYPGFNAYDFRVLDINDDGRVNARELYDPRSQAVVTRYKMAPNMTVTIMTVDTDGDFFVSYDELKAAYARLSRTDFNSIDANNDGRVHSVEYYAPESQAILNRAKG